MTQPAETQPIADENAFLGFITRYRNDPVAFVQQVIGLQPDPWQAELLAAIAAGERRLSIRSGHGTGKSSCASWAILWFFLTRYPVKIVITAPTSSQLFDALYAELRSTVLRLPESLQALVDVTTDRIVLKADPSGAFISARTSSRERPEALQGVHAENVMLVCDEASGIPEEVFDAAGGSMSGGGDTGGSAVTLLLGNPTRSVGLFARTHLDANVSKNWWTRRVSCLDSPRVSRDFINEMRDRHGEGSAQWAIRVEGNFPQADADTLIGRQIVMDAIGRDIEAAPSTPAIWGIDIARQGNDRSALAKRRGPVLEEIRYWQGLDLMATCGVIVNEYNSLPEKDRPVELLVDVIGLGAGVLDRLVELGLPARGINVAESSSMMSNCSRLRDELWMRTKEWFDSKACRIPDNQDLVADLTTPRFTFLSNGKLKVEGKSELRSRSIRSCDLADATCLTFASNAATATAGNPRLSWGRPLKIDTGWIV